MRQTSFQDDASDRRLTVRASLYLAATLNCDGQSFPVKIRNISSTGALLESPTTISAGALVQLVRGSLIAHGLVTWAKSGRSGLRFERSIDVQQWRATPTNAEQQRIDDAVRLIKAGAITLPVNDPPCDRLNDNESLTFDLQRASDLLAKLGDRLAKDCIVVAQYPAELQNLDIAMQVIDGVGAILAGRVTSQRGPRC
jgi:hypothetical protein